MISKRYGKYIYHCVICHLSSFTAANRLKHHFRPGEWEIVSVHFNELIYTVRGRVSNTQAAGRMPRQSVMAVGVTLPVTQGMGAEGSFW